MFEIGNSLREARLRQGLDIPRVEADTKIRSKYLQALESERFEVLPAETYVKGFLRTYAEYLGLDGQLYVDEFNSRFASVEEPLVASPPRRTRVRAAESNFVVVALAGIVAVTVLVVVAWQFGSERPVDPTAGLGNATTEGSVAGTETGATSVATTEAAPPAARPTTATLVLVAARGDCWMSVRAGSARGDELYTGTLEQGQRIRFVRKRIWITLGAPDMLDVKLNGKGVRNFPRTPGGVVVVTANGIRAVAT